MLKLFRQTLSSGVLRWVRPRKLVEAVYNSCRIVAEKFNGSSGITNTTYDSTCIRPMYKIVSVPLGNIHKSTLVAGIDAVSGSDKAGNDTNFFVFGLPKGVVAVGKAPDAEMGVLYKDFVVHGDGYIFKSNPEHLGVVDNRTGEPTIHFCCVGGEASVKDQPQFKAIYNNTRSSLVINAVDAVTDSALCLAGVSNVPVNATAGVSTIVGNMREISTAWSEGDTNYIEVGGSIYQCPREFRISVDSSVEEVGNGVPVTTDHINSTLVFPIRDSWYWVDNRRIGCDLLPNSLYEEYPELVKGASVYNQLATLLLQRGIVTIDITHSSSTDGKTISKYIPLTNSVHFVKHIDIDLTPSANAAGISNKVDTLYILYCNGGDNRVMPAQSCNELLHNVAEGRGSIRVTSCVNTGSVLYAISTNSTCYGSRITQSSKIYGIVAVIGGKTPSEDVVYSYKNINNEPFGAGLEVIVTALI